jgi:hypothetical protein
VYASPFDKLSATQILTYIVHPTLCSSLALYWGSLRNGSLSFLSKVPTGELFEQQNHLDSQLPIPLSPWRSSQDSLEWIALLARCFQGGAVALTASIDLVTSGSCLVICALPLNLTKLSLYGCASPSKTVSKSCVSIALTNRKNLLHYLSISPASCPSTYSSATYP